MTKVQVGFIGAGGIASRHVSDLLGFDDVQVAAFADPAVARAKEQAQRSGGQVYNDYRQMLEHEQLDALYICVPPFAHGEVELAAIERGIPFFVEKPLATDWATAQRIGSAVEAKGLTTAVGYHWRYLNTVEQAQELLAKRPARLALGYWLDATPPPHWWRIEAESGGQLVEQTTHIFDLARLLLGEVATVYAAGSRMERAAFPDLDGWDVSVATLKFASGALGTLASTCILDWPHRIGLHLFSEAMAIELSEFEIMVDVGRGRPVQKAVGDPFVLEDRDFIDAVQGRQNRIRANYREALKTHLLTTTATRAARAGQALDLDPSPAGEAGSGSARQREANLER